MKKLSKLFAVLFALAILVTIVDRMPIEAAAKKTVRVISQKELNKALKNSNVDTIIFRSEIYDSITINSKKAKKKNIIIDLPNSSVTNKSKFKSIEIQNAGCFIEEVTGNTITMSGACDLILSEGITVKKLILKTTNPYYTIRKGASIKTVAFETNGDKGVYDSKTRTIQLDTKEYEEDESYDVSYTYTLDKSGRVLEYIYYQEYAVPSKQLMKFAYDKNGNRTKAENTDYETGDVIWFYNYEYDNNNNMTKQIFKDDDIFSYKYDSNNDLIGYVYDNETYHAETTYTNYSNGRQKTAITISYYISDGVKGEESKLSITYKYDKKGNNTSSLLKYSDGSTIEYQYTYDKAGNLTYMKDIEYDAETGETNVWENKMEYDEFGNLTNLLGKTPYSDEWMDSSQYAG